MKVFLGITVVIVGAAIGTSIDVFFGINLTKSFGVIAIIAHDFVRIAIGAALAMVIRH